MPRIVFDSVQTLKPWAERFAIPEKYTAYLTAGHELILEPLRSTSPMRFGYIKCESEQAWNAVLAFLRERQFQPFRCSRYEWAADRIPGANPPQEAEPAAVESMF